MRQFLLVLSCLTLFACATGPTGPDAAGRFDRFNAVETRDFTGYNRVFIATPTISSEIQARVGARTVQRSYVRDIRPLGERDIEYVLGDLEDNLRRYVGRTAKLVDAPGDGVLTVATTLTALNANRPTATELNQNVALSLQSIAAGDSGVRIELSENGRLLAVIEDRDNDVNLLDQGARRLATWGTARNHFQQVGRRLAALLQG